MIIRIFITGGTFDKEYDELTGKLFFNKTHLREMLDLGRSKVDVNISTLMMIEVLVVLGGYHLIVGALVGVVNLTVPVIDNVLSSSICLIE